MEDKANQTNLNIYTALTRLFQTRHVCGQGTPIFSELDSELSQTRGQQEANKRPKRVIYPFGMHSNFVST